MRKSVRKTITAIITVITLGLSAAYGQNVNSLNFDIKKYVTQNFQTDGKVFKVRAYENIIYVSNPVDTAFEKMNIYIPEAYFEGGSINGYTSKNAPIFFPNKVGGYMPARPATIIPQGPGGFQGGMPQGGKQPNAIQIALSRGYIVASAGARGRTNKDKNGVYTGKAPAVIVDLKAAVRYLKFNDKIMPGDANKIISNGTSAGGALSVLLGATGNNPDYEPYLKAIGAAETTDDIFAVSAYCPITNLDNADKAYEWQFDGIYTVQKRGLPGGGAPSDQQTTGTLTADQVKVSEKLKVLFPEYVNSLKLKDGKGNILSLDAGGNGSFKSYVKSYVVMSAQRALDRGTDLSGLGWIKTEKSKVTDIDYEAYLKYLGRMKTPPAFDALDLSTPENQLFGTAETDKMHFTEFSTAGSTVQAAEADRLIIKMMNPMNYIGQPQTKTAAHWRIRHGTKDKDTGLAIPLILGTFLQNKGFDADLALPWDKPHGGDYDLDELFNWTDTLCKSGN